MYKRQPLYREIPKSWRDKMTHKLYFYVNLGWRRQYCGIEELVYEGITFYFVDNEYYFGRPYVYGLGGDEGERFAYFDRAVLEALPHIGFKPDVLHCHDWQTGMIPVLLRSQYQTLDFYRGIKTLFTVHNLQYQGVFSIDYIEDLLSLGSWAYTSDNIESVSYTHLDLYKRQLQRRSIERQQSFELVHCGGLLCGCVGWA